MLNDHCHRVSTRLQSINIIIIIIIIEFIDTERTFICIRAIFMLFMSVVL